MGLENLPEKIVEGIREKDIPLLEAKSRTNNNNGGADENKVESQCVVLVGTTGTGKTTCLNIYTGQDLETGDTANSLTTHTVAVDDKIHGPGSPKWVDNPGWSDTEGASDQHTFKDLLRHLQKEKLTSIKAVLWFVMPTPRMDSMLQQQAKFIESFTTEDESTREKEAGQIWTNVVIVCKGKLATELEGDVQGAQMAAKPFNLHAEIPAVRYEFASPEVLAGTTETLRKETLCMFTPDEVRAEVERVLKQLPQAVQVVFANQQCLACGQKGDPRLMEDKCHREKRLGHTGKLKQRFSKRQVKISTGGGGLATLGLIGAAIGVGISSGGALIAIPLVAILPVMAPGLVVAGHRFLNTKSDAPPTCGGMKVTDMRWSCCRMPELEAGGCTELCDLCGQVWGSGEPCVLIKHPDANLANNLHGYEVHVKEHILSPL